jgi:3-oxoacyl-[acyl-carrier protein] reductase
VELGLKDKVAIVTGSSRGLGKATAASLLTEGAKVVISGRDPDQLEEAQTDLARLGPVSASVVDFTTAEGCEAAVKAAVEAFGTVDILVNNVGGADRDDTDEVWHEAYDRNLMAAVRMCRLVVPVMQTKQSGVIIHVASIWGRESGGGIQYNAVKAAMISHAKNLALQLAPFGIRVNSVCPGSIRFPGGGWDRRAVADPEGMDLFVKENIAMGRFGRAEEVGDVIAFLCSDRASWVTGAALNIDGGQTRSNI